MRGSQEGKLEKRREEALSSVTGDRINVELMAQRARPADDPIDNDLLKIVLSKFTAIEAAVKTSTSFTELQDLIADGESQGIASAYFCPMGEARDEGNRVIDNMELWGIPRPSIKKLRDSFAKVVDRPDVSPYAARAALHAVFIELDEWTDYIDEYEETMRRYTRWLFGSSAALLLIAGLCFYIAHLFPFAMWLGLIAAGAVGSSVSVMAKMPSLDVSLSGELNAYGRRIRSRISTGTIGSLIGVALLGWGVLPLTIKDLGFADALAACTAYGVVPCPITNMLLVLGIAMLLGVSERTLTSFEQRLLGNGPNLRTPRPR
ncbi:hypothetical protein [Granulicella aggregans]|uniref:hypothetical protein n=1 Tax=Granulicella aggregans TaxID=474949 RepID=UPI0021E08402|nr:hypothetical protein [Granulicella aggregans]